MKQEKVNRFRSPKFYICLLIGALIGGFIGSTIGGVGGILLGLLLSALFGVLLGKPDDLVKSIISGVIAAVMADLLIVFFMKKPDLSIIVMVAVMALGAVVMGALGGVIGNFIRSSHTMKNVFHSPRFVVGFTIFSIIVLTALMYQNLDARGVNEKDTFGDGFLPPGTYFSVYDANIAAINPTTSHRIDKPGDDKREAYNIRMDRYIPAADRDMIIRYFARKNAWEQGYLVISDLDKDGNQRDIEAYREAKVAEQQAVIDEATKNLKGYQEIVDDPNVKEAQKRAYRNTKIPAEERRIEEATKKLVKYETAVLTDAQALEKWYDSETVKAWREENNLDGAAPVTTQFLREQWSKQYEPIVAVTDKTSEEKRAENLPEGFLTGIGYIGSEDGLGFTSSDQNTFNRIGKIIHIDPSAPLMFIQGYTNVSVPNPSNIKFKDDAKGEDISLFTYSSNALRGATSEQIADLENAFKNLDAFSAGGTAYVFVNPPITSMTINQISKTASNMLTSTNYIRVDEVANSISFPLGTDNAGHDMLMRLVDATGKSLLIGLLAGSVATLLGLLFGLLAGYVGGLVDDILTFIMNIFTVIPGFVLIIIIYNSVNKDQRGILMCGLIIGFTSWVWTARSVRSQVISLRNRDHVNLSKLSGHSLFRIILTDILPYIASYVVMAFILQVSSGILAEAQLSILGLGPNEAKDGATLGLLMNWAKLFGAYTSSNAWWAYFPVIGMIALISFSLNLMNTGLDQVFNPTLRD